MILFYILAGRKSLSKKQIISYDLFTDNLILPAKSPFRIFIYVMGIKFNHPVLLYSMNKKRLIVQVIL